MPATETLRLSAASLAAVAVAAADDAAAVFGDHMTAVMLGEHLTCTEAEAIARLLIVLGKRDAAATWLHGHAAGDDDAEYDLHEGWGRTEAAAYVEEVAAGME